MTFEAMRCGITNGWHVVVTRPGGYYRYDQVSMLPHDFGDDEALCREVVERMNGQDL